jgi:hypothetical protein
VATSLLAAVQPDELVPVRSIEMHPLTPKQVTA